MSLIKETENEAMDVQINVGDAVRHVAKDVIVRVVRIDADLITVESPSGRTSQHAKGALRKVEINNFTLEHRFCMARLGWAWGGWKYGEPEPPL